MYGDSKQKSTSKSKKEHKFFERFLDINLVDLTSLLENRYEKIATGEYLPGPINADGAFAYSNSASTANWYQYNFFQ